MDIAIYVDALRKTKNKLLAIKRSLFNVLNSTHLNRDVKFV